MNISIKKLNKAIITAILVLSWYANASAAEYDMLESTDPVARMNEIQRIGNDQDTEALPLIIEMTKDESQGVRINAVVALGQLGDERAIDTLIELMNTDPSSAVKVMAAQALGRFRQEEVMEALSSAAEGDDELVGASAVRSIGRMGGEKAKEKLLDKAKNAKNDKIKKAAVNSLLEHPGFGTNEKEINDVERILNNIKKEKNAPGRGSAGQADDKLDEIKKRYQKQKNNKKENE